MIPLDIRELNSCLLRSVWILASAEASPSYSMSQPFGLAKVFAVLAV